MRLNSIKPAVGSNKKGKRVGRGIGSTLGKTCGRGHKGQKSRSGGYHKVGFEGGQMPLQRRLPKIGFRSRKKRFYAQVCLHELVGIEEQTIDLQALKKAHVVCANAKTVKVIKSGLLDKPVTVKGIKATPGARAAIEAAGGKIEE